MAIKIPVSAQFDAADVKKQIAMVNDQIRILATQVGMANNKKYEPINVKSKEDLDAFVKQMQKLLKIQTELAQTMGKTGQGSKNPLMADWSKMYADKAQRIQKMQDMLQFLGVEFDDHPRPKPKPPGPPPPPPPPGPRPPAPGGAGGSNWRNGWGGQGLNVLNSGLRAAGPVGGVFSGALSSGLSGGAGAGLMGLVGGLAALGVGKIIGAIADKIGQAQDNAIGLDKVYRQIGGIVSYSNLKRGIGDVANTLGMKNSEAIGLASAYAKASNLQPGQSLGTGMLVSGGLARGYGIDPNSVANTMGQLGAAHITNNDQQVRKVGLIMGEAIGKSGAFAQAGEAMQAISNFATQQSRASLTMPNVGGYAGLMSEFMSTGIPGLDLQGTTSLLGRINATMMAGGGMGEASQAFTARTGMANGITDPLALKVLQRGGAFGTISSTLGPDTLYGKRFGGGYSGDKTNLEMAREGIHKAYGYGKESVIALARHMNIGENEAMALDAMSGEAIQGVSSRMKRLGINPDKANPTSYAALGQIESGKGLEEMGNQYLTRGGLDEGEKTALMAALKGTDPEKLKDVLTQVAAKHGGVDTEGSEIRDGIAQLNNTFENYASKALPAFNMMRMALVELAGGGEGDEASLRQKFAEREKSQRKGRIERRFDNANRELQMKINLETGNDKASQERRKALFDKQAANERQKEIEIAAMNDEVDKLAGGPGTAAEKTLTAANITSPAAAAAEAGGSAAPGGGAGAGMGGGATASGSQTLPQDISSEMSTRMAGMEKDIQDAAKEYGIDPSLLRGLIAQESRFRNNAKSKAGAVGAAQLVPRWNKKFMQKYDIYTQRGNIFAGAAHLRDDLNAAGGDVTEALGRYNGGTGKGRLTKENREYAPGVLAWQAKLNKIDPKTMPSNSGTVNVKADPLVVEHRDENGQPMKTEQVKLNSNFKQDHSWESA